MKRFLFLAALFFFSPSLLIGLTTGVPVTISGAPTSATASNSVPQVAVATNGNAFATWQNFPNFIQTAFYNVTTGVWTSLGNLAQGSSVKIGVDVSGNAFLVFVNSANQILVTRFAAATLTFSSFVQLSVAGTYNMSPQLAVNDSGVALVVFIQNAPFAVLASTFNPTTMVWNPAVQFLSNTYPASIGLSNVGTGIAIFQNGPTAAIQAATLTVP